MRLLLFLISLLLVLPVYADTITYYFDSYDSGGEEWGTDPEKMVDGSLSTYAEDSLSEDTQLNNGNTCSGTDLGTISKVEIRIYGSQENDFGWGNPIIRFHPVFGGSSDGDDHDFDYTTTPGWSSYFDITSDTNAPGSWAWADVQNLDIDVIPWDAVYGDMTLWYVQAYKIEIRVTYTAGGANVTVSPEAKAITLTGIAPGVSILGEGTQIHGATLQGATIY